MPRNPDPRRLLRRAIDAAGMTQSQFARDWAFVSERTVRNWLAGDARIPGPVLIICHAMTDGPAARRVLVRAVRKVRRTV